MAITGIDTIEGKQIIAAGAVSAKSAEMAYNDENGNPITGYLTAVPAGTMNESAFSYDASNNITAYNGSAIGGGSTPTYDYTDNGLISAIDSSGLYASSGSASHLRGDGTMGGNIRQDKGTSTFYYMPLSSPWTTATVATGIFSPLQYATGACLAMNDTNFKSYFKGNEWYVCNNSIGQALRGEVHKSRGVHISGATTAGYGFNLGISNVSGVDSTGSWKYGPAEDAALRAVSSCDMHESAFEYDASDNITAYNGSAFKAGDEFPQSATEAIETVTANSADWNGTTETVSSNSGAWGGSALPISAGPGIKFEMVDNTLVASTQGPILDEITIAGTWNGRVVKQLLQSGTFETNVNTDVIPVNSAYSAASSKWIDPSNSYIQYGSTANILPSNWVLGATGRLGALSLLNGIVRVRSNDTTNTQCTAFVTIKWCEN